MAWKQVNVREARWVQVQELALIQRRSVAQMVDLLLDWAMSEFVELGQKMPENSDIWEKSDKKSDTGGRTRT